jgi:hypothetical protein
VATLQVKDLEAILIAGVSIRKAKAEEGEEVEETEE